VATDNDLAARGFVEQVSRNHLRRDVHSHQLATVGIVVAGDRAVSEAYATIRLRSSAADGQTEELYCGRYLDRWSRRGDTWAIDHRQWVLDFAELDRPVGTTLPSLSSRSTEDPSYALYASLRDQANSDLP